MRRTMISTLCAAVLAAVPAGAKAEGLGSVVGAVANAPRAIFGGLFGGGAGKARHQHRHHARHAAARPAAAHREQKPAARTTAAVPAEPKPTYRTTPEFWPSAYDDVFGYILIPNGRTSAFWSRGYADVIATMFAPSDAGPAATKQDGTALVAAPGETGNRRSPTCATDRAPERLIEQLSRIVQPDEAQRAALDALGNAVREAAERVAAACSDSSGAPAVRLEAAWRRLRALRQAVILVRGPLGDFSRSLTEAQKAQLDASDQAAPAGDGSARACREEARMPDWPVGAIVQAIQPTEAQRPMLDLLVGTSLHSAHQLRAGCPDAPMLRTPAGRLDAAEERLTGIVYAVTALRVSLTRFYGALSGEQRTRFDAMRSAGAPEWQRTELR